MYQRHSEELIKSEHVLVTSGVDKKKGRKTAFYRTGLFYEGSSEYQVCSSSSMTVSQPEWMRLTNAVDMFSFPCLHRNLDVQGWYFSC